MLYNTGHRQLRKAAWLPENQNDGLSEGERISTTRWAVLTLYRIVTDRQTPCSSIWDALCVFAR